MKVAQALALFDGFDFVTPEQIQKIAVSVIAHRLVLEPQARFFRSVGGAAWSRTRSRN